MGTGVCPEDHPSGTDLPPGSAGSCVGKSAAQSEPMMAGKGLGKDWEGVWRKAVRQPAWRVWAEF